jgi:hypothetical protein|tara:strand:- start:82 stop:333 length:252 start_codon:yes stop_codon:yes gene_type:complete
MAFTTKSASAAGKKSKRGKDKFNQELKQQLLLHSNTILSNLDFKQFTVDQKIKLLNVCLPYLVSKLKEPVVEIENVDLPLFIN